MAALLYHAEDRQLLRRIFWFRWRRRLGRLLKRLLVLGVWVGLTVMAYWIAHIW